MDYEKHGYWIDIYIKNGTYMKKKCVGVLTYQKRKRRRSENEMLQTKTKEWMRGREQRKHVKDKSGISYGCHMWKIMSWSM